MPNMGMGNMQNMMRQAKKMQKDLENAQKELNASTFTGTSAQDMVTATFTGERKLTELNIKPEAIDLMIPTWLPTWYSKP